jgi:hypothetical protein
MQKHTKEQKGKFKAYIIFILLFNNKSTCLKANNLIYAMNGRVMIER